MQSKKAKKLHQNRKFTNI